MSDTSTLTPPSQIAAAIASHLMARYDVGRVPDYEGYPFAHADALVVAAAIDEILIPRLAKCADRIETLVNTLE